MIADIFYFCSRKSVNFVDEVLVVKGEVHRLQILQYPWILLLFNEPKHAIELAGSPEADHKDLKLLDLEHWLEESFKNKQNCQ